jgi:DNA primase
MDFIVLNSVSILRRAVPYLKKYDTVTCCFDNDDAGRQAVEMLAEVKDGIHDASDVYARYKDLNDFIRKKPYCP